MPTYIVTDPTTNQELELTGDSPPTEEELEQIFASQAQPSLDQPGEPLTLEGIKQELSDRSATTLADIEDAPGFDMPDTTFEKEPPLLTPEEEVEAPEFTADYLVGQDEGFFEKLGERMGTGFGAMTAVDDAEVVQMLKKYPHIKTQTTDRGTFGLNTETGQQFILNKPGFSGKDVSNALVTLLTTLPAGKVAKFASGIPGKAALTGAAETTREAIVQGIQSAVDGEFDIWDVAMSGGLGMLPDLLITPAMRARMAEIPAPLQKALDFAKAHGAKLTTSDVMEKFMTPAMRITAKIVERMPFIGTGSMKVKQKAQRARIIDEVAAEYGIDATTDFGETVLSSFARKHYKSITTGNNARQIAFNKLNPGGVLPMPNALQRVDDAIAEVVDLGAEGDQALLKRLVGIKAELEEGGRNFERMARFRTNIYRGVGFDDPFKKYNDRILKNIGDSISADMEQFSKFSKVGAKNWSKSNKIFRDDIQNVQNTELKKLIETGDLTIDTANRILDSNKPALLRLLYSRLDKTGRQATRQRLLQDVLSDAGWSGPGSAVRADKVLSRFERKKTKAAMRIFFPGVHAKNLDGMKEYLRLTAATEKIGQGVGMAATGAGGMGAAVYFGGSSAAGMMVGFAALVRAMESKPIRQMFLRLHYSKGSSKATERVMTQLRPMLLAIEQEMRQEMQSQQSQLEGQAVGQ